MSTRKSGLILFLCGALAAQEATRRLPERPIAPAVWVIGEGFRVDPITGRVREEMRLDKDPIPTDFDYTHKNLAWDARTGRVHLSAARNEMVAYQIQIRGPAEGVSVTCSDMRGPAVIRSSKDIEVFKQWYIDVQTNSSNVGSTDRKSVV